MTSCPAGWRPLLHIRSLSTEAPGIALCPEGCSPAPCWWHCVLYYCDCCCAVGLVLWSNCGESVGAQQFASEGLPSSLLGKGRCIKQQHGLMRSFFFFCWQSPPCSSERKRCCLPCSIAGWGVRLLLAGGLHAEHPLLPDEYYCFLPHVAEITFTNFSEASSTPASASPPLFQFFRVANHIFGISICFSQFIVAMNFLQIYHSLLFLSAFSA